MKKRINYILRLLTILTATVGVLAASLVGFILIYSNVVGNFAAKNDSAASQNIMATQAYNNNSQGIEQTKNEPAESKQKDKDPLGFNVIFSKTYQNDATGNWRLAEIAENIRIEEYALDYYKNYFESDNEIHIVINFTLNTTTRIIVIGNLLDVATMEYVDKEEHDATLACSGMLLSEYYVSADTGDIEKIKTSDSFERQAENTPSYPAETTDASTDIDEPLNVSSAQVTENPPRATETSSDDNIDSAPSENNFDTYNNPEQQQSTDAYVLNTSSNKIHYPHCSSVAKIAPQNYATSSASLAELKSQGYSTCGICFK